MALRSLLLSIIFIPLLMGGGAQTESVDEPRVVFVGDSLTLGALSSGYVGFAGMASQELGWDESRFAWYHVGDAISRWDKIDDYDPDIVVIELGVHAVVGCDHLLFHNGLAFREQIGRVMDLALLNTSEVYVVNAPWLNWATEQTAWSMWYNYQISEAAGSRGVTVVDAWSVTANCGECIGSDGFHLNDLGHQRIADALVSAIREE